VSKYTHIGSGGCDVLAPDGTIIDAAAELNRLAGELEGCQRNGPHSREALLESLNKARDHESALSAEVARLAGEAADRVAATKRRDQRIADLGRDLAEAVEACRTAYKLLGGLLGHEPERFLNVELDSAEMVGQLLETILAKHAAPAGGGGDDIEPRDPPQNKPIGLCPKCGVCRGGGS